MSVIFKQVGDNILGFDIIEVIQFNYDGQGSALAYADNYTITVSEPELSEVLLNDEFYEMVRS
ncbi:hypothetical protein TH61_16365 [Rufibacter sp. DG15C]|nr:hypothetical protein TH61_16365 [Rufibacter sp. DG15C]